MKTFVVSWEIELDATSAEDAAKRAWEILRAPNSMANVFSVRAEEECWPEKVDIQACIEDAANEPA